MFHHHARVVQRAWKRNAEKLRVHRHIRDMTTCVVCADECVRLVRCKHAHPVCLGCRAAMHGAACPVCRDEGAMTEDVAMPNLLRVCGIFLHCATCQRYFPSAVHEAHRAWCSSHKFRCPFPYCTRFVRASDMASHMVGDHGLRAAVGPSSCSDVVARVVFGVTVGPQHDIPFLVNDDVVVATFNRLDRAEDVSIDLRAIYANARSTPLIATVRQLRVIDCEDVDRTWLEDYRFGIVPPTMASRVHRPKYTPTFAPHCRWNDTSKAAVVLHAQPTSDASEEVCRYGIRDRSFLEYVDDDEPRVAIVRLSFRRLDGHVISTLIDA